MAPGRRPGWAAAGGALWLAGLLLGLPAGGRAATCDGELAGFERAYCEIAALRSMPLCGALPPALDDAITERLGRAEVSLRAAEPIGTQRRGRRLQRARRNLRAIQKRAARAERRDLITMGCRAEVDARLGPLRALLSGLAMASRPLPGLPADVAGYDRWLKLNAAPIPPVPGSDPHAGYKDVFVNQPRETIAPGGEQRFPYPEGSIVVKAVVHEERDFIWLFSIMRKGAGSNPDTADWTFVEYVRNDPGTTFRVVARGAVCSNCHVLAAATDYVFTLLP